MTFGEHLDEVRKILVRVALMKSSAKIKGILEIRKPFIII